MNETPTNRRDEPRIVVLSDCTLEPRSPSWTMLPQPLEGQTFNITEHGLRIHLPGFEAQRYEKWFRHLEKGECIGVSVELHGGAEALRVEGQIVWLGFSPENDDQNARTGELSVGILLSLLDEGPLRQLQALIRSQQQGTGA
jgi:hypothetical protein